MRLIEVKCLGGTNYVRAELVMAIQTSATGNSVIVMEGGTTVQSSEMSKDIAARIEAALKF